MATTDLVRRRQAPGGDPVADAVRTLHAELERRSGVALPLRLWDGAQLGDAGAGFRIVLLHPWSLRRMLSPPADLSAGEAYVDGAVDFEGDPVAAVAAGAALTEALSPADRAALLRRLRRLPRPPRGRSARRARLRGRLHSRARDRAAVAFHYDLPQTFYESFLDRNLVYSCAYFAHPGEALERAQERKLDVICRKLRLRPGLRLLDIGCGWGSLLLHAARHYGATGEGVTLSRTQAEAAQRRIVEAGLEGQVEVRLADYRDVTGRFDVIASVGMVEHVGPENLERYTAAAFALLEPGGLFCNHGIVTGDAERVRTGRERTFVSAYVFPDGGLVPAWRAVQSLQRGGFEILDVEQLRPHYALTLRRWIANLQDHHDAAAAAASEADYRIWRAYMAGSAYSFASGSLGVVQVLCRKPGGADPPLGRAWMLPADESARSITDPG